MAPVQIKIKDKKFLFIRWGDTSESSIRLANLRRVCPCAVCNAERDRQGNDYIPLYNDDEVTIMNVKIVGYYGINVQWKDGHNLGIYDYEGLKRLSER
ncbi:MAG: DUF971 domain-containing protein [Ignavibacteriales bacterium]